MIFVTGDTHRKFSRVVEYIEQDIIKEGDILIILGDVGINYYTDSSDIQLKKKLNKLGITFFCVQGNHELRPENLDTYKLVEWNGGMVYIEEEFPNLVFAKDGEIYTLEDKKYLVCGGAYSVDKEVRILRGLHWFKDEQPSKKNLKILEENLCEVDYKVNYVLTHTCPQKYTPTEAFMSGVDQSKVDRSTEIALDKIEDKLEYDKWFCGHWHINKNIDKIEFMFEKLKMVSEKP